MSTSLHTILDRAATWSKTKSSLSVLYFKSLELVSIDLYYDCRIEYSLFYDCRIRHSQICCACYDAQKDCKQQCATSVLKCIVYGIERHWWLPCFWLILNCLSQCDVTGNNLHSFVIAGLLVMSQTDRFLTLSSVVALCKTSQMLCKEPKQPILR